MGWVTGAIAVRTACIVLCTSCTYCQACRGRTGEAPAAAGTGSGMSAEEQQQNGEQIEAQQPADGEQVRRRPTCRRALRTGGPGAPNRAAHCLEWPSWRQLGSQADGRSAANAVAVAVAAAAAAAACATPAPMSTLSQVVTPWDVTGGADGKIDYNKLVAQVGECCCRSCCSCGFLLSWPGWVAQVAPAPFPPFSPVQTMVRLLILSATCSLAARR